MACLFASRLAEHGGKVTMLGSWPEGLAALQQYGIRRVESDGSERTFPVRATANPDDCAGIRFALVLVKSWQTERAAAQLARCLSADGLALTLQNGLGNRETLARALGPERVALGVTTTGATLLGPGRVRPGGEGITSLGEHPRLPPLAEQLRQCGFALQTVANTDALLWGKLAVNAAINPLTAILRVPNGELLNRPAARQLMASLAQETAAVAAAQGIELPFADVAAVAENVARRTAANRSSMLQDIERGAPTEIDAICGAIAQCGEQLGVPTPVNRTLWLLIGALRNKEAT